MLRFLLLASLLFSAQVLCSGNIPAQPNAPLDDLETLSQAYQTADLARKVKSPEALLGAAALLARVTKITAVEATPVTLKAGEKTPEPPAQATEFKEKKLDSVNDEVKELLAEAREMARGDETITALASKIEKSLVEPRGAIGGPVRLTRTLAPGTYDLWTLPYQAGKRATVTVTSSGRTAQPFSLIVLDRTGRLVGQFTGQVNSVVWLPPVPSTYVIRVQNVGLGVATYRMNTN